MQIFSANGFSAKGFLNSVDAIDALYTDMYDLIISDIMMPQIDGFEFAKKVRECNANIAQEKKLTIGNLVMDKESFSARIDGDPIQLTSREFKNLYYLLLRK